ncbi:hypothetical protein MAC_05203 [Metarhizium acridum CQMa 102]|uniref:Phosphotransferase enzyme family protein n=1 Tax=Metarhizium acridum (strain CQMa 102) TaxID=655827 RepID=E9E5Q5_METAQ|nr:uncharacterized protein MAC_05203 [Metarhizium acridum CQMa 102]EFY88768.1 hypothetical protein MAC_05203 [Metarhizium acridum CQMa 102]
MSQQPEPRAVAKELLSWIGFDVISCSILQTLWAGYGHICAIHVRPLPSEEPAQTTHAKQSLVLKIVSPPHGRKDEGHLRKVFSYQVEQHFYDQVAPTLDGLPLAECLVSTSKFPQRAAAAGLQHVTASVLTDLRLEYPVAGGKRTVLTPRQVHSALRWLSRFHGSYWKSTRPAMESLILPPLQEDEKRLQSENLARRGLWLNGGYTYLATRRNEYNALAQDGDSEWSQTFCQLVEGTSMSVAELAAFFLTPTGRDFETYLHGDVKSENLFSTDSGDEVAFFDFQYTGLGLGVCDLAKLFTCSVPVEMLTASTSGPRRLTMGDGERHLLHQYRQELLKGRGVMNAPLYDWIEFQRHWETALVDWCRFQASWGFWGNTKWLQARVRSILHEGEWLEWIKNTRS